MPNTIKPKNHDVTQRHIKETSLSPDCLDEIYNDDELSVFASVNDSVCVTCWAVLTVLALAALIIMFLSIC